MKSIFELKIELLRGLNRGPLELLRRALPYQPNGSLLESTIFVSINQTSLNELNQFSKKLTWPGLEPGPPGRESGTLSTTPTTHR